MLHLNIVILHFKVAVHCIGVLSSWLYYMHINYTKYVVNASKRTYTTLKEHLLPITVPSSALRSTVKLWGFLLVCKAETTRENCPFMSYKHVMRIAIKIKFKAFVFCSVFSIWSHTVSNLADYLIKSFVRLVYFESIVKQTTLRF